MHMPGLQYSSKTNIQIYYRKYVHISLQCIAVMSTNPSAAMRVFTLMSIKPITAAHASAYAKRVACK